MVMGGALVRVEACEMIPKALSLSFDERVNVRRPSLQPRFQNLRLHLHYSGRQSICASRRAHVALPTFEHKLSRQCKNPPGRTRSGRMAAHGEDFTVQEFADRALCTQSSYS